MPELLLPALIKSAKVGRCDVKPARRWLPDDEIRDVQDDAVLCVLKALDADDLVPWRNLLIDWIVSVVAGVLPSAHLVELLSQAGLPSDRSDT